MHCPNCQKHINKLPWSGKINCKNCSVLLKRKNNPHLWFIPLSALLITLFSIFGLLFCWFVLIPYVDNKYTKLMIIDK